MKVAVTGGSGFIGRPLVDALIKDGHDVSVLTRRAGLLATRACRVVIGDLTSDECPLDCLLDRADVIFHCAGEVQDETRMRSLHIDGTRRLLSTAVRHATRRGTSIHWVQLSSVGAYGPSERAGVERVVTETTPVRPRGEYELTKTESDSLVARLCDQPAMSYSIVRPSNVFGDGMSTQSVRGLTAAVRQKRFFYIGRPGAVATFVHVRDVVETLRRCGTDPRARGHVFNVSNDCLLEEMIEALALACRVRAPRVRLPEGPVRAAARLAGKFIDIPLTSRRIDAMVSRTRYPHLKLQRELGFVPQFGVPETIGEVAGVR